MSTIYETMPVCRKFSDKVSWKSLKTKQRLPSYSVKLIFVLYSHLKMSLGQTVLDLDKELIKVKSVNFEKPKLFFKKTLAVMWPPPPIFSSECH